MLGPSRNGIGRLRHAQSHEVEDTSHIQIKHFLGRPVWRGFEWTSPIESELAVIPRVHSAEYLPCRAGIRYQDINLVLSLPQLINKSLNILSLSNIGSDANCGARDALEGVEFVDRLVNALLSLSLPRRDNDLLRTRKQECCRSMKTKSS